MTGATAGAKERPGWKGNQATLLAGAQGQPIAKII